MRKKYVFAKKVYISILTSILVIATMAATTFAWVGVLANSTFETFSLNLKGNELDDYSIEISVDGINFSDSLSGDSIKKQILLNWGYPESRLTTSKDINELFGLLNQEQATNIPEISGGKITSLGEFTNLKGETTTKLFKFDIYVSARKNYDVNTSASGFGLDVYLDAGLLTGHVKSKDLINSFTYPSDYINPYDSLIALGNFSLPSGYRTIKANETITTARVDSASAGRVAFEKYEVVDKYHPEQYTSLSRPVSAVIYQDAYEYPVYDEVNKVHSFGAILPNEENIATGYYNSTEWEYINRKYWVMDLPDSIANTRGVNGSNPDLRLSKTTNHLIDSRNLDEKISIDQMMKMTIYFWFEGWDADCFNPINLSPVDIKIGLSMDNTIED